MQPADSAQATRPWRVVVAGEPPVQYRTVSEAFEAQVILLHSVDGPVVSTLEWYNPKTGWQKYPY